MKNRIFCLLLMLTLLLSSCKAKPEEVSEEESISDLESTEEASCEIDEETELNAKVAELLEKDKEITDIFVRGSLSGGKVTEGEGLSEISFDDIISLMDFAYAYSETKDYYLSFPCAYGASVYSGENGNAAYFYRYIDSKEIDISSFSTDGNTVEVGDITIPLIQTKNGLKLGGSLYIESGETRISPDIYERGNGSAAFLKGNIFVLAVYIGTNGKTFPDDKAGELKASLQDALNALEHKAEGFGAGLNFTLRETNFNHKKSFDLFGSSQYEFEMLFSKTSLGSLDGLAKAEMGQAEYDGYAVIVVADGEGECISRIYADGDADCFSCERIMVSPDVSSERLISELLYIFGDNYGKNDKVTAYRVGWIDSIEAQFSEFVK